MCRSRTNERGSGFACGLERTCRNVAETCAGYGLFVGKYRRARRSGARILQNTGFIPLGGGTLAGEYTKAGVQHGVSSAAGRRAAPLYRAVRRRGVGQERVRGTAADRAHDEQAAVQYPCGAQGGRHQPHLNLRAAAAGDYTLGAVWAVRCDRPADRVQGDGERVHFQRAGRPREDQVRDVRQGRADRYMDRGGKRDRGGGLQPARYTLTRQGDTWADHAFL